MVGTIVLNLLPFEYTAIYLNFHLNNKVISFWNLHYVRIKVIENILVSFGRKIENTINCI